MIFFDSLRHIHQTTFARKTLWIKPSTQRLQNTINMHAKYCLTRTTSVKNCFHGLIFNKSRYMSQKRVIFVYRFYAIKLTELKTRKQLYNEKLK